MAQINKSSDYFNTVLWTGDGTSSNSITGVGFQPDLNWIKRRSTTASHHLQDIIRGSTKSIYPNLTNAEGTDVNNVKSFDSDGFTLGNGSGVNTSSETYVAWNWLASNTTASNTDGSITSTVSANTTSGFSIVSYTGNSTAGATIGHGLSSVPKVVLVKNRSGAYSWYMQHASLGATQEMLLDTTRATDTSSQWNNTAPTSTVFTLGNAIATNVVSNNYVAYCFAEKKGFSKFGSYTGNGSADGTFVYTGFKPAFVITKCTSTSSAYTNWGMFDSKRPGYNQIDKVLGADLSDSENGSTIGTQYMDFLSNGFKCRNNGSPHNISGATYIYMAFAEQPLTGTNGVPCTAR